MKAKPAKTTKPASKATNKAVGQPKTAAKAAKPAAKAAVKSAKPVKPVAKPAVLASAKKVTKPAAKAKPAVKKSLAKTPVVKTPPKPVAQKPIPKAQVLAKPLAKVASQPVPKTTPLVSTKPASKSAVKAGVKPATTSAPKVSVTSTQAKPLPTTGKKPEKAAKKSIVMTPGLVPAPPPVLSSNGLPPPPPLKPGRRSSSRALAHMPPPAPMVPTHAPDAAKASYSTITERVIAPPPYVAAKKDPKLANNWKTKTAQTLTDDEAKAMPDAEYMNDMQMAFFRHKLSILKQDIHNSAGATTEHLREDTAVVPDPADRATIEEEHALELRTRDRERKLLKKIEQSIARIDSGDYGYCDETGEAIGVGRLIARPTASLSLEAQQRRELKQKMFGD